ncbi:PRC-barrel domain-containing protein [Mycolicibacterium psychrotolerans]|uniref:PRC-barrel domain-containing protein n=1 Tax=Mycolicibacterium psychrotolerans TaxID=216929 RepID=A0A7I7MAX3_9MYCO|nr:hypothetical protein [Mycolicibacterium psychrotolerans]BBX68623.1 hypothetical protein MPSYJ_20840 [Mycolicibacterium psychrotolerans]
MSRPRSPLPEAPRSGGLLVDARLHLLDRQLLGTDDAPVGIVDDLEVDATDGRTAARVTAILTGQVLATRILGGQPPRSRLEAIPWRLVSAVGTVLHIDAHPETLDNLWVERWLRDHVIARIPGGRRAAQ